MGRSSRLVHLWIGLALLPTVASAQVYGFPSAVGVLDDGFGTLPPEPPPYVPPGYGPPSRSLDASPAWARTPCALIIQVGKGLRHRAATRVVYGHAAPCR